MSDRYTSIYFIVFAVLYLGYTAFVAGHGIHGANSIVAIAAVVLAAYFYLRSRERVTYKGGDKE